MFGVLSARRSSVPGAVVLALSAICATACAASVPMAPKSVEQSSKTFQPPPGKANLYAYRPSQFKLSAVSVSVTLNGQSFGMLGVGTYLYAAVSPGQYTLLSASEEEAPAVVVVEAGQNYFFQQEIAFGSSAARTALIRVDEAQGREAVLESEMAASQGAEPQATATAGCSKDTDCKGDRVCVAGSCTDAPPKQ
jgi:hypothetical protein